MGDSGRSLVLNGHVDVVSAEPLDRWARDPFGAEIADGRMYGRGSCDMKGGVAAMLLGVEVMLAGASFPGSSSTRASSRRRWRERRVGGRPCGPSADAALIAEPTNGGMDIVAVGVSGRGSPRRPNAATRRTPTEARTRSAAYPVIQALHDPRSRQRGARAGGRRARAAVPPQRRGAPRGIGPL